MAFNLAQWKQHLQQNLPGFNQRMRMAGVNSVYAALSAAALIPIVEAYRQNDFTAFIALGSVLGNVGVNLISNIIQNWRDEAAAAREIEQAIPDDDDLRQAFDKILTALEAPQIAEQSISPSDRDWFLQTLRSEMAQLGSQVSYTASAHHGAIAQGDGAKAVGQGGALIEGNVNGDIHLHAAPDPQAQARAQTEQDRRAYLEGLHRRCQVLPLAGLGGKDEGDDEISLEDVYIALDTSLVITSEDLEDLRSGKKNALPQAAIGKQTPETDNEGDVVPLPALDAIRYTPRAVLLGDPGAGKSTFARNLIGLQAAALLNQCEPLPGFDPNLLPILIVLRDLIQPLANLKLEGLATDEQKHRLLQVVHNHLALPFVLQALQSGKVLLVLDGLDEVPPDLRLLVRRTAGALLSEYRLERLLVTSRVRSYTGEAVFPNLQTFTLRPFDEPKIKDFVRAWYNVQARVRDIPVAESAKRTDDLVRAATSSDLMPIASNPMMLTSMAIVHQEQVGLPKERVRLYKLVVDVLLRRWQKHKLGESGLTANPDLLAFLKDERRLLAAVEHLAYAAHQAGQGQQRAAELSRPAALALLEQRDYLNNPGLAGAFLDYIDQRSGLMQGVGGVDKSDGYVFPHRTFQEYLAGCYLIRERTVTREYRCHAAEGDTWSVAALLGAEELYYNRRMPHALRDLAYGLLRSETPHTPAEQRATLWSAQIAQIAERDEIENDTEGVRNGADFLRQLPNALVNVLQGDLPPLERAEAGKVLAELGDPRAGVQDVNGLCLCCIPGGKFVMGSVEGEGASDERPQHELELGTYWISEYPITQAQYGQFMDAGGYSNECYWAEARKLGYWKAGKFRGRYEDTERTAPVRYGGAFELGNHPVVGVTWFESLAFTGWLTEQWRAAGLLPKDWCVCLPSEAEWEKAARGGLYLPAESSVRSVREWDFAQPITIALAQANSQPRRTYPWGNEPNPNFANYGDTGIGATSAVGAFPGGVSPYGVQDLSGNVWEWTRTLWAEKFSYPYNGSDGRERVEDEKLARVVRGGSFLNGNRGVRCAVRFGGNFYLRDGYYGFRVVVSPCR